MITNASVVKQVDAGGNTGPLQAGKTAVGKTWKFESSQMRALMAELVYARGLSPRAFGIEGSNPSERTHASVAEPEHAAG